MPAPLKKLPASTLYPGTVQMVRGDLCIVIGGNEGVAIPLMEGLEVCVRIGDVVDHMRIAERYPHLLQFVKEYS